jgi:hypothetical protein
MASGYFQVQRCLSTQLNLRLGGEIDEETVLDCEREVRMRIALVERDSLQILWDLRDVESYTFEARIVLVRLQRFLAVKAARTVYVAAELAARSLALWAAHMGGYGRMCIASDVASARAWLAGETEPTTGRYLIGGASLPDPRDKDKAAG